MQPLPTFDLVLFGGTGDLAMRKLLPALYRRRASGYLSAKSRVIGVARSDLSRDEYLAQVQASCQTHLGKDYDEKRWAEFSQHVDYLKVDASSTPRTSPA